MSLKKIISLPIGLDIDYHKIEQVTINKSTGEVRVVLMSYSNELAKDTKAPANSFSYIFKNVEHVPEVKPVEAKAPILDVDGNILEAGVGAVEAVDGVSEDLIFDRFVKSTDVFKEAYLELKKLEDWLDASDII